MWSTVRHQNRYGWGEGLCPVVEFLQSYFNKDPAFLNPVRINTTSKIYT